MAAGPSELNPPPLALLLSAALLQVGDSFQLERLGYFAVDKDAAPGRPVLNRTVALRESAVKKKM